jgi:hypothetical protein
LKNVNAELKKCFFLQNSSPFLLWDLIASCKDFSGTFAILLPNQASDVDGVEG